MAKKVITTALQVRKNRKISDQAKQSVKTFNDMKKKITEALKSGPKSIPQIAKITNIPSDKVLFYLMTMQKFGLVTVDSLDDMDEYYLYKLVEKKKS